MYLNRICLLKFVFICLIIVFEDTQKIFVEFKDKVIKFIFSNRYDFRTML